MSQEPFYITTPIYYVNASPHLGHAYTTILADTIARYHRLAGREVYFLTGTDEHGDKIAQAAAAAGEGPQAYADRISAEFRRTWERLGIAFDQFIRTTEPRHRAVVQRILQVIYDRGEIYRGEFGGHYCFGCERFYTEREMVGGTCPDHHRPLTFIKEENYFFRMGRYQDWLVRYIEDHPDFIRPERYRNEVLGFLREPLQDLCISRPRSRLTWGIPLPFDDAFVTYVWFDALINYVSALGSPDGELFRTFWPAAQHLIGKDIVKPHAVYWPTMLRAAGIAPYRHLNVHGYWLVDEAKMSKSAGRVAKPLELADTYGLEAFRYFLLREMTFGLDANFSEEALVGRLNADLANDLGNLLSRTLAMVERYLGGRVPDPVPAASAADAEVARRAAEMGDRVARAMGEFGFSAALDAIWGAVGLGNKYIDEQKPWELAKREGGAVPRVLFHSCDAIRIVALHLYPFMPLTADRIWRQLGIPDPVERARFAEAGRWGAVPGRAIRKGEPLFPRVEMSRMAPPTTPAASGGETTGREFEGVPR